MSQIDAQHVDSAKAGRPLQIHVRFTNHCFSESFDPTLHGPDVTTIPNQRPLRVFSPTRYGLSQMLPATIQGMTGLQTQVQQTVAERNWVHSVSVATAAGPYHIFFVLRRANQSDRKLQDLNMTIESAYPQRGQPAPQVRGRIGFTLLAGKVFLGEPVATRR